MWRHLAALPPRQRDRAGPAVLRGPRRRGDRRGARHVPGHRPVPRQPRAGHPARHRPLDPNGAAMSTTPHDDELVARISRALHSREADQPDPAVVAARLEGRARARRRTAHGRPRSRVGAGRLVAAGVVTSTLAVAGAGAAAAANPYSGVARVVEEVAQSVGLEWSAMPDGYTREQYEAFWGAGYTVDGHGGARGPVAPRRDRDQGAGRAAAPRRADPAGRARWSASARAGGRRPGAAVDAFWAAGYTERGPRGARGAVAHRPVETKAQAGSDDPRRGAAAPGLSGAGRSRGAPPGAPRRPARSRRSPRSPTATPGCPPTARAPRRTRRAWSR